MPTAVFAFDAATPPAVPTSKGGSRYVLVPADWPRDARVRLLLIPAAPKEDAV